MRKNSTTIFFTIYYETQNDLPYFASYLTLPMTKNYQPTIKILAEDFEIPQLEKKRRITALLPYDYEETKISYPVLYLQDGQNLFDENAPFGNWAIDRSLGEFAKTNNKIIVVAIDHGDRERINEYTPFYKSKFGRPQGKDYMRFVSETLKPYIDKNFRTLPDREHTGLGGSSLGGLISIYGGIVYPHIFSKLMIFSPSLWIEPRLHIDVIKYFEPQDAKMYLYAGGSESKNLVMNVQRFKQSVEQVSQDRANFDIHLALNPEGTHNEYFWQLEFPKALKWLYF